VSRETDAQPQAQGTLLDWLRVKYGIEKPCNRPLTSDELDSNTWVSDVKRIRGKTQPLTAGSLDALRGEYPPHH
jgi:hypothetical protein